MWERIHQIIRKEFLQTLRDTRRRGLLVGPPILQLIIFGYAVNLDVEHTRLAWIDRDHTPESREFRASFEGTGYFHVSATPETDEEAQALLDHGRAMAIVQILPGFARDLKRGNTASVQILVDGTNSNTAAIVSGYAGRIVSEFAARALKDQQGSRLLARGGLRAPPVNSSLPRADARTRIWFNPDLKSRVYFVPGIIVNIIGLVTIMLTAMSIVREREIGTMEQLMVTPIRPIELMLGKILPYALVGLLEVALVLAGALLIFSTPLRGSVFLLFACSAVFLLTTLGIGLFMSTISHTQQQAMMTTFFFFMPAMLLSGFAFPIRNMPFVVRVLTYVNPMRYFMEIVRGIFLKGTGLDTLWPHMLILAVIGVIILTLSALRFHKRLD